MSIRKREKSSIFRIVIIPERLTRQQKRQKKSEKGKKKRTAAAVCLLLPKSSSPSLCGDCHQIKFERSCSPLSIRMSCPVMLRLILVIK